MTYRDFAQTSETERRMEALVELARAILHVSKNPFYDRSDWTEYRGIPSTPSLN